MDKREKYLELVFTAVFSALIFVLFFFLLGANGLVLGNDPAVHLQRAQHFLNFGWVPISDIAWYPPLYHLLLATFMAFTGATSTDQVLVLMKAVTALMDWLLVFSVYLISAKFFSKKTGVLAAALLLVCFPLFEINSWGGYTSILALAYMTLTFMYLASPLKSFGPALVAAVLAFSVVMSHQLATFISVFILLPFIIVVLIKSRGRGSKVVLAVLLGGGVAFFIYYLRPILPYLGDLIYIVFFQLKTMLYQVPTVTFDAFMVNFGFVVFLAFAGLFIAFFELRKKKALTSYLILALAFLVPFAFSQFYLVGLMLPFQWFVYYMTPFLVVLAGVSLSFVVDLVLASYFNHRSSWKRVALKVVAVAAVCILVAVMVVRFQTLSGRIGEATVFYSISDMKAYDAGAWLQKNYPDPSAKVVVTEKPGHWFSVYSGRDIIAETDPVIEWNVLAESVLDLSYEMEHPLTMVRAYEAKAGNVSDEFYASMNMVWRRMTHFSEDNARFSYRDKNDMLHSFALSSLNRTVAFDELHSPKVMTIQYSGEGFVLTEKLSMANDTYAIDVVWQLSALGEDLNYPILYLSEYFDPKLAFNEAYVPGLLNWANPWSNASHVQENEWAAVDFSAETFASDNHVSFYDSQSEVGFSLRFLDVPDFGNVGALYGQSGFGNVDAVRWQYEFFRVDADYTVSVKYQVLAFSMSSYPELEDHREMNTLFDSTVTPAFEVRCRNFASIIRDNFVCFLVYDGQRFDQSLLRSNWLELVYSNEKYAMLKVKVDHPYANVLENVTLPTG